MNTGPATPARPTGITVLAVLSAIGGVFGLFGACALFGLGALGGALVGGQEGAQVGFFGVLMGILGLGSAGLSLAFAYGAWNLKPWAWMLGLVGQGLGIATNLYNLISGSSGIFGTIISLIIPGIIIYYLFTPEVKRAFGRA